jgi:quercetin dioxygenase-like cupin family protein
MSTAYESLDSIRPLGIWDGTVARAVHGKDITMAVADQGPNVPTPEHQHVNEQVGIILKGSLTFTIGGDTKELGPGDIYLIPSNTPHSNVAGPEGCTLVDIFHPVRSDWDKYPRLEPSHGEWP